MAGDIPIGQDALGQYVGYGDLVAVTKNTGVRSGKRAFIKGIVIGITPKSGFKLSAEDGTPLIDSYTKRHIVFPQNYTVLIVHADKLDKYNASLLEWEQTNTEKAGK